MEAILDFKSDTIMPVRMAPATAVCVDSSVGAVAVRDDDEDDDEDDDDVDEDEEDTVEDDKEALGGDSSGPAGRITSERRNADPPPPAEDDEPFANANAPTSTVVSLPPSPNTDGALPDADFGAPEIFPSPAELTPVPVLPPL